MLGRILKDAIIKKLSSSGYIHNFYLYKYQGNKLKILLTVCHCFFSRKALLTEKSFVDYDENQWFDENEILEKLMSYDVVSFDVFDTLLFRKVSKPTEVFSLVEKKTGCRGYAQIRVESEKEARAIMRKQVGSEEVSLRDIYLAPPLVHLANASQLMVEELKMEKNVCCANNDLQEIVNILVGKGKTVIAVSDMYLPKSEIQRLLEYNGYRGFTDIYVSCEYGASKSTGTIFRIVKEKIDSATSICHIGDNFYSDIMAQKNKIDKAIQYVFAHCLVK